MKGTALEAAVTTNRSFCMPTKYIYVMRAGKDHYKVGIAADVSYRLKALQTGNAMTIKVLIAMQTDEPNQLEKRLHLWLDNFRASGEWFTLAPSQALCLVAKVTECTLHKQVEKPPPTPKPKRIPKPLSAKDERFDDAVQVAQTRGKASASLLQRQMKVGYARAARLLDELEKEGVVSEADGARARHLLEPYAMQITGR